MTTHQVQQCLQRSNAKYVDSAKKDVMGALSQFKELSPGNDSFIFPDGKRRNNAFRLKGTIPVYYKGNCYNIPVTVFLWETHPYYAPLCFVNPTSTMVIKESEHVNKEGRVFLPYLNEWRFPGYDLSGLLQVMAMVFQEKCPVFAQSSAKTKSATSNTSSASSNPTPYPSSQSAMPTPYPTSSVNPPYPPTATPYPSGGTSGYNPYMNVANNSPYPVGGMPTYPKADFGDSNIPSQDSLLAQLECNLREKLNEKLETGRAEMASIQSTANELLEGQQKLKKIFENLENQRNNLQNALQFYKSKKAELEKAINDAGGVDAPPIDEAIDASTPLHRQIVTNYAKDLTCDDVIYALGQALKHRKITLTEYLRRVRDVSREQFIYRAMMQKCRRVAGLPI